MTRSVLVDKVSEKVEGLTRKQTEIVMETVFDSIKEALPEGRKDRDKGLREFQAKDKESEKGKKPQDRRKR